MSQGKLIGKVNALQKRVWFYVGNIQDKDAAPEMWLDYFHAYFPDDDSVIVKL